MNVPSDLGLLLRVWLAILLYIVFLGILSKDWGGAIFQGLIWGLIMSFVLPRVLDLVAERELRKSFHNSEQKDQKQ